MRLVLALALAAASACATVASIDVTRDDGPPPGDRDDGGATEGDGGPRPDGPNGVDAAADRELIPEPPKVCACPIEEGCCVPSAGPAACAAPASAPACTGGGGVFLRCAAGDVANGRACCLAADGRSTSYATSCPDGGAQLCATMAECEQGVCLEITCRAVSPPLRVCVPAGTPPPSCPP